MAVCMSCCAFHNEVLTLTARVVKSHNRQTEIRIVLCKNLLLLWHELLYTANHNSVNIQFGLCITRIWSSKQTTVGDTNKLQIRKNSALQITDGEIGRYSLLFIMTKFASATRRVRRISCDIFNPSLNLGKQILNLRSRNYKNGKLKSEI